jgi:hypothetical protein
MPFKLKSPEATYQRGIQKCLHSQLECNTEAYVNDVVIKIQKNKGLISDLVDIFDNLRKFTMKLNPENCTFDVPLGKILRYMVSRCRIEPNPKKVSTITNMAPPKSLHDVKKLTGCMASLSRFISRLSVRGPFLQAPQETG